MSNFAPKILQEIRITMSQCSMFNSQLPKGIYIYNGKKILK